CRVKAVQHPVSVHVRFYGPDRVHLTDYNIGAKTVSPHRNPTSTPAVSDHDHGLAGYQQVRGSQNPGPGWCGRGIAMRADGLGANVIICEVDPVRAIEAHMDGYRVLNSLDAAAEGDMFVTASGCKDVLREEHFSRMKNGAVLANAGHFNVEINQGDLEVISTRRYQARHNIEGYVLPDGRVLYLLAEGRLVNLAAGDGHPAEIMDLSFALQALAARHILAEVGTLEKRVYNLPPEIDRRVAGLKLASLGITIDELTAEQTRYLQGWE
nr:adenosylhomocysteinase [Bacillota bacterium]